MVLIFRIMVFVLLVNLSAGILSVALAEKYPTGLPIGIAYNESLNPSMTDWQGNVVAPGTESSTNWLYKFFDFLKIGIFLKVWSLIDTCLYGIISIFNGLGILNQAYVGYMYGVMTIIYILGIIDIWTGRKATR